MPTGATRASAGRSAWQEELRSRTDFDAAIFLQNAIEAALIAFLAGIPTRIGFDTDARRLLLTHPVRCTPAIKSIHQTGYYLKMLEGAGLVGRFTRPLSWKRR
jgi:heptosyltransferase-2